MCVHVLTDNLARLCVNTTRQDKVYWFVALQQITGRGIYCVIIIIKYGGGLSRNFVIIRRRTTAERFVFDSHKAIGPNRIVIVHVSCLIGIKMKVEKRYLKVMVEQTGDSNWG